MKNFNETNGKHILPNDAKFIEGKWFLNNGTDYLQQEFKTKEDAENEAEYLMKNKANEYGNEIKAYYVEEYYSNTKDEYYYISE